MVKFGIRKGIQRYRCRVCRRTLSDAPENPLVSLRVPFEKAVQPKIHALHAWLLETFRPSPARRSTVCLAFQFRPQA
ncbi:MAG TPA: hypothetical protein VHY30_06345 [Verrucomicrobiae bacterium]|nr:hypothetical protein [Verrucomicrobiae bacterium]